MSLTQSQRTVLEETSAAYTATVTDELQQPLSAGDLTTLTLTLYDQRSRAIINTRENQNALNANGVTVDAEGNVAWTMEPGDNVIVGTPRPGVTEKHIALFQWTWAAGTKAGKHELLIEVQQVEMVT